MSSNPLGNLEFEEAPAREGQFLLANILHFLILLIVVLGFWFCLLELPNVLSGVSLESWIAALGQAAKNHMQAGKDYVYTFGPASYFTFSDYNGDLFWYKLVWELVIKLVMAIIMVRYVAKLSSLPAVVVFCGLATIFTLQEADTLYLFPVLLLGLEAAKKETVPLPFAIVGTLTMAIFSLVSFTILTLSGVILSILVVKELVQRRWRAAITLAAPFAGFFALGWVLLGQSLYNLPDYLAASLQFSNGYAEAMALYGSRAELVTAAVIVLVLGATLLARGFGKKWDRSMVAAGAILAFFIFAQWKHGFVRHDAHSWIFFASTMLIPFVFPIVFPTYNWQRPLRQHLLSFAVMMSVIGFFHAFKDIFRPTALLTSKAQGLFLKLKDVGAPTAMKQRMEAQLAYLQQLWEIPRIKAVVGNAPVDIFSYQQGLLFLNQMNWRPRPVFQSYCAYTPYLASLNADYFRGPQAPPYVLFTSQAIDTHYPTLEDGPAFVELCGHYFPVLTEKGFVLMKKREDGPGGAIVTSEGKEHTVGFNQVVPLEPSKSHFRVVTIKVSYSLVGKARMFLYKVPPIYLHIRTTNDQDQAYRFIPSMGESSFLIDPFIPTNNDLIDFYLNQSKTRVAGFWISTGLGALKYYLPDIKVTVKELPFPSPDRLDSLVQKRLRFPMIEPPPESCTSTMGIPNTGLVNNQDILFIQPEGEMVVAATGGVHKVMGSFGIAPPGYEQGTTDGVVFSAEYHPEKGKTTPLFERKLDPKANPADRGFQPFDIIVKDQGPGKVIFKTMNKPGMNCNWDWAYWSAIDIR